MKYLFVLIIVVLHFSIASAQVFDLPTVQNATNDARVSLKDHPLYIISVDDKKVELVGDKSESSRQLFKELNPNWIEKVEVVKGEKATDQFGERGKFGVILIELKEESFEKMPVALSDRFGKS